MLPRRMPCLHEESGGGHAAGIVDGRRLELRDNGGQLRQRRLQHCQRGGGLLRVLHTCHAQPRCACHEHGVAKCCEAGEGRRGCRHRGMHARCRQPMHPKGTRCIWHRDTHPGHAPGHTRHRSRDGPRDCAGHGARHPRDDTWHSWRGAWDTQRSARHGPRHLPRDSTSHGPRDGPGNGEHGGARLQVSRQPQGGMLTRQARRDVARHAPRQNGRRVRSRW
mmetsp:Transcript_17251/g.51631  ORF Transcript_17251/g.51631 Transcript_17251/m.51631 type:complete len:221 (+) Transcript_17251:840-1502(+)